MTSGPESEFDFESIVWSSYTEEEREALSDAFAEAERKPDRRGPGLTRTNGMFGDALPTGFADMRGPLFCAACGLRIEGAFWSTSRGPLHPECLDD